MGWMQKCYETYENNVAMAGRIEGKESLGIIAHMNTTAQLEITLTPQGDFVSACVLDKDSARTLIPVTESSATRSSGVAPHALCDTLSYIAADFEQYVNSDKERTLAKNKFHAYRDALKNWCESEYSCEKIRAVYAYIEQEHVIADLLQCNIVELENGCFSSQKISGKPYDKALVRFRVLGDVDHPDGVWQDKNIINNYITYSMGTLSGQQDICYVNAKRSVMATNHPKGIVAANYGAKLISANDVSGFTFRGRFQSAEQAYAISYEASQKAHSALHWVVANQGVAVGTSDKRTFVCWNPEGKKVMNPFQNPFSQDEEDEIAHTNPEYKEKLYKTFMGYRQDLGSNSDIVVMGLDAATKGRLSITYYNELYASDFYDRIEEWYQSFRWYYTKYNNKKPDTEIRTPSMSEVIRYAFGTEDANGRMVINDKLYKEQMQRLIRCMLDAQPLPRDLVHALFLKASSPLANSRSVHNRILSTACAAIVKRRHDISKSQNIEADKEEQIMVLDENNRNRSYLFGRLLAIVETVERITYTNGEAREPNAMRYQSVFVNHPFRTWGILEKAIIPYYEKMTSENARYYYKGLIQKIVGLIKEGDQEYLNRPLDENYLLGYYLQREELYHKRNKSEHIENV